MVNVEIKDKDLKAYLDLRKTIKFINENHVLVGVPDDTTNRKELGGDVTNAELMFIHTNGSPVNNIPPRPVIEPALYNDKDRITKMLNDCFKESLSGNKEKAISILRKIGMRAQNVCRAWFVDPANNWLPNSPATAEAKIRRFRRYNKTGNYEPRPLIDTGELRKSITYVLSLKGRRSK